MKRKCECPDKGVLKAGMALLYHDKKELPFVEHEKGKCECTNNIKLFKRDGKKLWLCSCCNLGDDVEEAQE